MSEPNAAVEFVLLDDLPRSGGVRSTRYESFWTFMDDHPGKWGRYPGVRSGAYVAAERRGYECRVVDNVAYVRKLS